MCGGLGLWWWQRWKRGEDAGRNGITVEWDDVGTDANTQSESMLGWAGPDWLDWTGLDWLDGPNTVQWQINGTVLGAVLGAVPGLQVQVTTTGSEGKWASGTHGPGAANFKYQIGTGAVDWSRLLAAKSLPPLAMREQPEREN